MTTQAIRDAMALCVAGDLDPCSMQFFDISKIDMDESRQDNLALYRPPFDKCFVVARVTTDRHGARDLMMFVAGSDPEIGIVIALWDGPIGKRPKKHPMFVYAVNDGVCRYGSVNENEPIDEVAAHAILHMIDKWYESMSRTCEAYRPVLQQTFTNRRKIAAGKIPAYGWHTVKITPVQSKAEPHGGTHASPRLHDRRGHLRRLRSGKNTWVRPCKVGDATLGTVFHDYQITA